MEKLEKILKAIFKEIQARNFQIMKIMNSQGKIYIQFLKVRAYNRVCNTKQNSFQSFLEAPCAPPGATTNKM